MLQSISLLAYSNSFSLVRLVQRLTLLCFLPKKKIYHDWNPNESTLTFWVKQKKNEVTFISSTLEKNVNKQPFTPFNKLSAEKVFK